MLKVSIITVCKNSEAFLEETIKSVINQTYEGIEYIVIDGNSTDSTVDIIKLYSSHLAYWASEQDYSMYDAINKGLGRATGDYILVLNSDDSLVNDHVIENVVKEIEKEKFDFYYGNVIKLKNNRKVNTRLFQVNYMQLLYSTHGSFVHHPCFFISRELNEQLGGYDLKYKYASDYDYILRALNIKNAIGKHMGIYITAFRFHANSITSSGKLDEERKMILAEHNYYKLPKIKRLIYFYLLWGYYKMINLI